MTDECKAIRLQIDEVDFRRQPGGVVAGHLSSCPDCRAYAREHLALGSLLASLEPVTAPPDFDFRLRARLAREKGAAQESRGFGSFLKLPVSLAATAVLLILVSVVLVLVRNTIRSNSGVIAVAPGARETKPQPIGAAAPADDGSTGNTTAGLKNVAVNGAVDEMPSGVRRRPQVIHAANKRTEGLATREFSLSPAAVIVNQPPGVAGSVVRVPLDAQVLRISIDDERGDIRTISLPRVSFGSQRLAASQSFVPVSARGVW